MTPDEIKAAREWLSECYWRDMSPEDFETISDAKIIRGIARHYDGGIEAFRLSM